MDAAGINLRGTNEVIILVFPTESDIICGGNVCVGGVQCK